MDREAWDNEEALTERLWQHIWIPVEPQEPDVEPQEPDVEPQEPDVELQEPDVEPQEPDVELQEPDTDDSVDHTAEVLGDLDEQTREL
jgi:hypothetical protein